MAKRRKQNRGIVLLVVLSLLVLFVLVGVTFVVVSSQYQRAAVSQARYRRYGEDPRRLFDIALLEFLRDTTNERSSLLSHSVLRDLYDSDGIRGIVTGVSEQAGGQFILIRYVPERGQAVDTAADYYNGRVCTILDTMWNPGAGNLWGRPSFNDNGNGTTDEILEAGSLDSDDQLTHGHRWSPGTDGVWGTSNGGSSSNGDDNNDGIVNDIWEAGWPGSDDTFSAGIGHMVYPGADGAWGGAGVNEDDPTPPMGTPDIDESDEAGWPGSDDGYLPPPKDSVRIVDSGFDATLGWFWLRVEAFQSDVASRMLPTVGTRLLVNGAAFNGTGVGYRPHNLHRNIETLIPWLHGPDGEWGDAVADDDGDSDATDDPDEANWPGSSNDDQVVPVALAPNVPAYLSFPPLPSGQLRQPTADPFVGGVDESWDAVDFQNMFLAMVPADKSATPYIIPSFHRPELVRYWGVNYPLLWAEPAIRRAIVMRPMHWDHPNFSGSNPYLDSSVQTEARIASYLQGINPDNTTSTINPWDVDNDADGDLDSIWLDIGLPLQTTPDGRLRKPLVAILCKDLDGRLNVNFHGNGAQILATRYPPSTALPAGGATAPFAGAAPQSRTSLPRGAGFGPADIYLGHLFGSYTSMLNDRYGGDSRAGVSSVSVPADDILDSIKHTRVPRNFWGNPSSYASPPDMWGRGTTALDYLGQPMTWYMGANDEREDNPYQFSVQDISAGVVDSRFTDSELERILRWYDLDQNLLSRRLRRSDTAAFNAAVTRESITSRSSHVPVPNVTVPSDLYARVGTSLDGSANVTLIDLYRAALSNGGFTGNIGIELRKALPTELLHGQLFNVNHEWGNGRDDNGNLIVDEMFESVPGDGVDDNSNGLIDDPAEFEPNGLDNNSDGLVDDPGELALAGIEVNKAWGPAATSAPTFDTAPMFDKNNDPTSLLPRASRQLYARHLYCLMSLLIDTTSSGATPAQIAQWAINVVDFRDADSSMTPFEYDINPFNSNGWQSNLDGDPSTNEASDRAIVWGCERPELLITESVAFHDRATQDLATDNGIMTTTTDGTNPDPNFDQQLRPRGSFFVELYNPWTGQDNPVANGYQRAAEFYYDHRGEVVAPGVTSSWNTGVILNKTAPGGFPVWRMLVVSGAAKGPLVGDPLDPDDPASPLAVGDIDRSVYFASPPPSITDDGEPFHTTLPVATLKPGRYAVVGSSGRSIGGGYVTTVGRRTDAIEGTDATLNIATTRRIVLTPNANPDAQQVRVLDNAVTTEPTTPTISPTIAVAIDFSRSLSITEPTGGYEALPAAAFVGASWLPPGNPAAISSEGNYSTPTYTTPIDRPLDSYRANILAETDVADLLQNQTVAHYRVVHLQRLANPMAPWDVSSNPYLTVDSSSVDVSAFNGVADDAGDPELGGGGPNYRFHSLQRGGTDGRSSPNTPPRVLWRREPNMAAFPATENNLPTDSSGAHHFAYELGHSLGFVNSGYLNQSLGTFDQRIFSGPVGTGTATHDLYIGAPKNLGTDSTQPFPWLTWNNRPFVSPHELLLVPTGKSSQLMTTDYAVASDTTTENYTTAAGAFSHLPNFFHATPLAAAHMYRLFDYLEVPSAFMGTEKWYQPTWFTNTTAERTFNQINIGSDIWKPADTFRPPFNRMSRFRDPGRVNINTIFDEEVWEGIAKGFPAMDPSTTVGSTFWDKLQRSRRGYGSGGVGNLDSDYPTRFSNPFRSSASSDLMPRLASASVNIRQNGVQAGLLRSDPDSSGKPLFSYDSATDSLAGGAFNNTARNPYFKYQGISRLSNMLTTHSNVFAVWMSVGFFEVEPNPSGADNVHPDGYRLSREVGIDTGEVKRHRMFFLIDRSIPVAFEPGEDHNVERTVLLRRFIE